MRTLNQTLGVAGAILALGTFFPARAWSNDSPLRIKVLSSESYHFQGPPLEQLYCDWRDLSAYCFDSRPNTYVENTMVVRELDGKSLEIACTVYNQWSRCTTLPVNQTFEAWTTKHGLKIRFLDPQGKMREQLYEIREADVTARTPAANRAVPSADGSASAEVSASFATTSATSDTITVLGVTPSSHCQLTATNQSAATNYTTAYVSAKSANNVTVTHAPMSGMTYDVTCSVN